MTALTVPEVTGSWTDRLLGLCWRYPGGIRAITIQIGDALGTQGESRNTYSKLFRRAADQPLTTREAWRLWLVLTVLGEPPEAWGITDDVVPPLYNLPRLKQVLCAAEDSNLQPAGWRTAA